MKRGMDPFRAATILNVQEKIESISYGGESVYIGTAVGNILQFSFPLARTSEDQAALPASSAGAVALAAKRPVEQVCATSQFVFALSDGVLYVLPADVWSGKPVELCKDVKHICLHTGLGEEAVSPSEVCVATRKKLILFGHNGNSFEQRQEFPTSEAGKRITLGQRVVELGSGTGYVGLIAAAQGHRTTMTDRQLLLPQLQANIKTNGLEEVADAVELEWGGTLPFTDVDSVIMSDCVYLRENIEPLMQTLELLAPRHVIWANEIRGVEEEFQKLMIDRGWTFEQVPLPPENDFACEDIRVQWSLSNLRAPVILLQEYVGFSRSGVNMIYMMPPESQGREYKLYSERTGLAWEDVCPLDGKHGPRIAVLHGNELLLLIQENVGLFYNLSTKQPSPKNMVTWPRKVTHLGASANYVFGSSGLGQLDVYGIQDQKNCQTLTLEGVTVAVCQASAGRALIAAETSVTCLSPVPFDKQVKKLLLQVRINDARELITATYGPEDPERQVQLGRFQTLAGWALFRDLQFLQAFEHFMYCVDFRVDQVLMFWGRHLPAAWQPPSRGDDDGSPEPVDIKDFVRSRLGERQPPEVGDAAVSANVGLANAAAVSFLLKQREAILGQERLPQEQRTQGATSPASLLRAMDTLLLKLLLETDEDDVRLTEVLEGGVRCRVEDCEGFLRERGRLDVLARLWKAHSMYDLVLRELSAMLTNGRRDSRTDAPILAQMVEALRSARRAPHGADLLREYVPQLLLIDAEAVLPVFVTTSREREMPLEADEVLELLQGHDFLVLTFLEDLVEKNQAEPRHCAKLGLAYVAKVEEELSLPGAQRMTPTRTKLLRFLEEAAGVNAELLPRLEALQLHEERVIVCGREGRHREALRILVLDLNDLMRAEVYCRLVMAKELHAGVKDEVSVFSVDLPSWARGVVFGPKKPTPGDKVLDGFHEDPAMLAKDPAEAARPLMLLLQILLEAHEGAAATPEDHKKVAAEYRDAALSLLMGYAAHRDLPPNEVLGCLPARWPLEGISDYLSKCARICLHKQRASMLEENLSSMAYLKTFSAWAKERMRKVNITADRCCPVCNKRFVDKDSVGKAFVAYPNETCVHFTCKEHASICPKTGKNFADNLSVYCHALRVGQDEQS
ncbi:TGFBRAP1 [Symbiodinium pilosum]|uniref:TGFBRAP1 protein n=1 Tax=Symbiodinium pilosum TaxID=2952 RepID=A0A812KRZ2_SYMPI|nr:TGFBRAP1 [Symbiodinium pilosum]